MIKFKSLFNRRSPDFRQHSIDLHSHLLPGIDDGVKTISESLEIIRCYEKSGFRKLITTPHIHKQYYENTPLIIKEKLGEVRQAISETDLSITVEAAAEYYMDDWFLELIQKPKELLTFGDNLLLMETSFNAKPLNISEVIFELRSKGIQPILAHPERYTYAHGDIGFFKQLKDQGVYLQLNINSLGGFYGPDAQKMAQKLVDKKMIDLVGSDCHSMRHFDSMMQVISRNTYWPKVMALSPKNDQLLI